MKSLSTPFKQLAEQFPTVAPGVDCHLIGTYFLPWKNHVMVHSGICVPYEAYDNMSTKILQTQSALNDIRCHGQSPRRQSGVNHHS